MTSQTALFIKRNGGLRALLLMGSLMFLANVLVILPVGDQTPNNNATIRRKKREETPIVIKAEEEEKRRESYPYRNNGIPNILIAGTQKASTSSLSAHLKQQPHICYSDPKLSSHLSEGKETHFFDTDSNFSRGLSHFKELYKHCTGPADILVDATPETMLRPDRVKATYEENGQAMPDKIIMILREPVSREISWYNHQLRDLEDYGDNAPAYVKQILDDEGNILPFIEHMRRSVIEMLKNGWTGWSYGIYAHWLKQWFEMFDRESILILSYDELKRDPSKVLQRMYDFLDLPEYSVPELPRVNTNSKHYPNPPCKDQLELAEYYRGPNKELYELLASNPGPPMEERPFPEFRLACETDK